MEEPINFLKPYGRCPECGRFVKRGLSYYARHQDKCPEKTIFLFSMNPSKCKLIKRKDYIQWLEK